MYMDVASKKQGTDSVNALPALRTCDLYRVMRHCCVVFTSVQLIVTLATRIIVPEETVVQ